MTIEPPLPTPLPGAALIGKRINVLDKGWIELQDLMGNDLAVVNAARASFLGESKGDEKDKKLLFYMMRNRHTSPFEQVEFKFRVRAPVVTCSFPKIASSATRPPMATSSRASSYVFDT